MLWNREMASEQENYSESTSSIFLPTLPFRLQETSELTAELTYLPIELNHEIDHADQ
jgi:hypothetical protein